MLPIELICRFSGSGVSVMAPRAVTSTWSEDVAVPSLTVSSNR
jgi:hypothetical protein